MVLLLILLFLILIPLLSLCCDGVYGVVPLTPPVVRAILSNLALPPAPQPLIPYAPFSWIPQLRQPPPSVVHLPFMYAAARWMGMTWLGWGYVEPSARRKYGLPN